VSSADEQGSDAQDPEARGLGLGFGQRSVEARHLGPRQQRAGDEGERPPGLVAAMSSLAVSVMEQVWRNPSEVSNKVS